MKAMILDYLNSNEIAVNDLFGKWWSTFEVNHIESIFPNRNGYTVEFVGKTVDIYENSEYTTEITTEQLLMWLWERTKK